MKMKKQLLLAAMAAGLSLSAFSQTKGTNALSFGVNTYTNKGRDNSSQGNNYENKTQNNFFTLGYGYFFKDNSKFELDLSYGLDKYSNNYSGQQQKSYGGNLNYQHYFPIVKTLFAYAGGRAGYTYSKIKNSNIEPYYPQASTDINNQYSIGAYGGITWFTSQRFALETSLLSADFRYSKLKQTESTNQNYHSNETTNFNLNTQGFINNLGFKIYILF